MKSKERARDIMSINIQERVLDTLFDIAVEEIGVCDDMTRAYDEWYQFCTDNTPDDQVDEYLNSSTRMQRESFIAGAKMALALVNGKEV